MDYKLFIQDLDNSKKVFVDYILSTNKKNIVKVDKLVNEYLDEINNGNYSIKSYKAKIIHNELEHARVRREIGPIKEDVTQKINDLIETYFNEYLDELNNLNILSSKNRDLREFNQNNRRQKHEVLLKKNNIEKEFNVKVKEFEVGKQELIFDYNEKINDLKIKLSNNLKKSNDKTIKEFQEYESKLLDCNDRQEIKNIKEKIKNVRLGGLDEEHNFKVETYQTILDEELKHNQNYFNYVIEYENYKKDVQDKLAEYEKINTELTLNSELRESIYPYELKKNKLDLLLLECAKFVENVNKHNQKIIMDYSNKEISIEDKLFLFDMIEVNLYQLLLKSRRNNLYDPLIYLYTNLIDGLLNLKNAFKDVYNNMNENKNIYRDKLVVALDSYATDPKKKISKEELIDNVLTSLDRYYNNFTEEVDNFIKIVFDLYMTIILNIEKSYESINKDQKLLDLGNDGFIKQTNYYFVDLTKYGYNESNTHYDFRKFISSSLNEKNDTEVEEIELELDFSNVMIDNSYISNETYEGENSLDEANDKEEVFIHNLEDSLQKMEDEIRLYCNYEFQDIENQINELNVLKNKKLVEADNVYKEKIKMTSQKYKNICDSMSADKIKKEKEIKKLTAKYISNANKLLSESKSML